MARANRSPSALLKWWKRCMKPHLKLRDFFGDCIFRSYIKFQSLWIQRAEQNRISRNKYNNLSRAPGSLLKYVSTSISELTPANPRNFSNCTQISFSILSFSFSLKFVIDFLVRVFARIDFCPAVVINSFLSRARARCFLCFPRPSVSKLHKRDFDIHSTIPPMFSAISALSPAKPTPIDFPRARACRRFTK